MLRFKQKLRLAIAKPALHELLNTFELTRLEMGIELIVKTACLKCLSVCVCVHADCF